MLKVSSTFIGKYVNFIVTFGNITVISKGLSKYEQESFQVATLGRQCSDIHIVERRPHNH